MLLLLLLLFGTAWLKSVLTDPAEAQTAAIQVTVRITVHPYFRNETMAYIIFD